MASETQLSQLYFHCEGVVMHLRMCMAAFRPHASRALHTSGSSRQQRYAQTRWHWYIPQDTTNKFRSVLLQYATWERHSREDHSMCERRGTSDQAVDDEKAGAMAEDEHREDCVINYLWRCQKASLIYMRGVIYGDWFQANCNRIKQLGILARSGINACNIK